MNQATLDPAKGPITLKIVSGYAQPGSYTLYLIEADTNRIYEKRTGHLGKEAVIETLPASFERKSVRLRVSTTVRTVSPIKEWSVNCELSQGGKVYANSFESGAAENREVSADQHIDLTLRAQ